MSKINLSRWAPGRSGRVGFACATRGGGASGSLKWVSQRATVQLNEADQVRVGGDEVVAHLAGRCSRRPGARAWHRSIRVAKHDLGDRGVHAIVQRGVVGGAGRAASSSSICIVSGIRIPLSDMIAPSASSRRLRSSSLALAWCLPMAVGMPILEENQPKFDAVPFEKTPASTASAPGRCRTGRRRVRRRGIGPELGRRHRFALRLGGRQQAQRAIGREAEAALVAHLMASMVTSRAVAGPEDLGLGMPVEHATEHFCGDIVPGQFVEVRSRRSAAFSRGASCRPARPSIL